MFTKLIFFFFFASPKMRFDVAENESFAISLLNIL